MGERGSKPQIDKVQTVVSPSCFFIMVLIFETILHHWFTHVDLEVLALFMRKSSKKCEIASKLLLSMSSFSRNMKCITKGCLSVCPWITHMILSKRHLGISGGDESSKSYSSSWCLVFFYDYVIYLLWRNSSLSLSHNKCFSIVQPHLLSVFLLFILYSHCASYPEAINANCWLKVY